MQSLQSFSSRLNPYSNGMKIELVDILYMFARISLNPYSNGMKIERMRLRSKSPLTRCLNPYSNGMKIEQDGKRIV